jgi:dTDP-3-amino-3,4,6-trideoxy-alpha-D-glucose transaminase
LSLRCAGLRPGDKVVTTPLSAFATTLAILRVGAVPVFVDVDASGSIDLERCRDVFKETPALRYFVPVHLYGRCLDLDRLQAIQNEFNLVVIEDCAQSIGAAFRSKQAGTVGRAAAVSFYPTKNLGALGDGGMLLTADPAIAERARRLRNYGQSSRYFHEELGMNSRLDELQAALLRNILLPQLDAWTRRRQAIAHQYRMRIHHEALKLPAISSAEQAVWHLFPLRVQGDRAAFRRHLEHHGIMSDVHYPRLIPDQPALQNYKTFEIRTPLTEAARWRDEEVSLPIHPFLSDADVDSVVKACNAWEGSCTR